MASSNEIEEFLEGPLVTWFRSCLDDPYRLKDYDDLADGVLIYQVLLLIDPEPVHHGVSPTLGNPALRTKNMDAIIKNIKTLYEEELCQLIVVLPDASKLGREPESKEGLENMNLLLLLLLGCAVQCPNKQTFIEQIKSLHIQAQHSLVDCIKQVTESQEIVLTPEGSETVSNDILLNHIKNLVKQRDSLLLLAAAAQEESKKSSSNLTKPASESQHLAVELADWKAKLRKQRQELEEKSEALSEVKEELECNKTLVSKLKNEIVELKTEARICKAYRDEADSLREKAERCERLEAEVTRYRERLSDLEYYRSRVEELRQDNRVLEETREMLEEQLTRARARVEYTLQLEANILQHKQTINELSLEREANQEKLQELFEENAQLALLSKSALHQDSSLDSEQLEEMGTVGSGDNSLSEQLTSNAQARVLRLELENRRLTSTVESLQEATLHQTNERVLQLEKEKKKLSLQVEELEETKRKLTMNISELETTVKNAQRDTKKMQDLRDTNLSQLQSRADEVESLQREKQKLEKRLEEAEHNLEKAKVKQEQLEELADLKSKCSTLEKEVARLKKSIEVKAVNLDKLQCEMEANLKERSILMKQLEETNSQMIRLHEVEREWKELDSKYEVDKATLSALQKELVHEKLNTQQLKSSLDKLGLALDQLSDPENALDRILSSPEILRAVKERLGAEEGRDSDMAAQKAQLEVDVATLQSQISSLASQHTALQLANSQLVGEKDELSKTLESLRGEHQQMLLDQLTLQSLHEQLSTQYETLVKERDTLKGSLKESRSEARNLKDQTERMQADLAASSQEIDNLRDESHSLANLRTEHSKLKEDFKNLFTANDKLKAEYRTAQVEYRNMKSEFRRMTMCITDLQGQLSMKDELITQLEVQLSKMQTQFELLKQVKNNLEEDRKSLMEHVTLLLGQYHDLLTHSLEDKEHYHMEEKLFTDKLNNLCRQKEKLEEKIMEQYRKMESCPPKKKSFGASFVRRVRKAGSELINKSRRSWHEDAGRRPGAGTDSDTSQEDFRTRQDGLGTPGTRRTLYMSGDENNSASTNEQDDVRSHHSEMPRSSTPQDHPPFLVYNRVTNVLGSSTPPKRSQSPLHVSKDKNIQQSNDIWEEYGCI